MTTAARVARRYLRASRLLEPPLNRQEMETVEDAIILSARENARDTVGPPGPTKIYEGELYDKLNEVLPSQH